MFSPRAVQGFGDSRVTGYSPMSRVHLMKDDLVKGPRILSSSSSEGASEKSVSAVCASEGPLKAATDFMMTAC